ncbi:MAG: LPS export ABC transporter permease LptF [Thermodesulfobacteriota bacterium]|jgi:lipopolysaccharide export system permease protein|nr:MAG: LPS export ABC transporter permease LptF [Thermodesulfobacteriota bacterium]
MVLNKFKPKIKIIDHYLFNDILTAFGVCVFILTFTALMGQVFKLTSMVINKGFGFVDTLKFLGLLLPSICMFVIPMSLLLGILTTLGRMSTDGEIIAFKASGISLSQILRPILMVSLIAFFASNFFSLYLSPNANYSLKKLVFEVAKTKAEVGLKERIFDSDFEGLTLYVNQIDSRDGKLEGVLVSDTRQAEDPSTIIANEGYLIPNPEQLEMTLQLKNGSIHRLNQNKKSYQKIDFETYNFILNLQDSSTVPTSMTKEKREMSFQELWRFAIQEQANKAKYYDTLVELHSRFSTPFACLVFGFLAVPLGIFSPRAGRAYGFVISLIVILMYYILFSLGESIGSLGMVHPMIAMWLPNVFFLLLSFYLFKKIKAETPILILEKVNWYLEIIKNTFRRITEGTKPLKIDYLPSLMWDINNSTKDVLMLKLGIGEKRAAAIIAYREARGGIKELEELKKIRGISDKTLNKILENLLG